ncbi:uncharacterized protein F4812DRAFT_96256 [Daldinia caldariorum]|uniref:uncharacterized protein n=1 Tax=Daldinia caldariorum TaxID=326644 RepID=UPI0020085DBF|nr:uncharacterized protein F4812DRAFT_96256 [Daldinia caldariorum]KAI1466081.1 hypothetical protein F4812DRAFT_96256 [Daldinia caldariorum]
MAPQKPRCTFKECKSAAQRIVGDCGFCDGHFCAKHRLLEDHKCSGLEDVSMSPNPSEPSPCPCPSENNSNSNGSSDDWAAEWWQVGLAEYLEDSGLLLEEQEQQEQQHSSGSDGGSCSCSRSGSGSGVLTTPRDICSARRNRTRETPRSSRPSARKSSGAYNHHYHNNNLAEPNASRPLAPRSSSGVTARQRRRRRSSPPRVRGPVYASTPVSCAL